MDLSQITTIIDNLITSVIDKVIDDKIDHVKYLFNTNQLHEFKRVNKKVLEAYNAESFIDLFTKLDDLKNHCLYWFEIENETERKFLLNLLNDYRSKKSVNRNYRTVPAKALKRYKCNNSKILYVGVRRGKGESSNPNHSNIARRINQHLGYYTNNQTQGLQLVSYAYGENVTITLKIFEFSGLKDDYLNLIEKELARKLNPLCGRH